MRRPSLRSQLNQIRLWVRQGRTDAWIAHKLDISTDQLEQFKRDHRLDADAAPAPQPVSVAMAPIEELREQDDALEEVEVEDEEGPDVGDGGGERAESEEAESPAAPRRRRRGRRGGRRRSGSGRSPASYEGTFDHGDEGYGLWLDPAVADSEIYAEHWAGHREVTVTIEPDAITIRRPGAEEPGDE